MSSRPPEAGRLPPGDPVAAPRAAAALVLAGGAGRRFGGDKLAASLDGRPLLDHAILAAAAVADRVVVVVAADGPLPALPADAPVPVSVARDAAAGRGPLAGVLGGLDALGLPPAAVVLVLAGDAPRVPPSVLGLLAAAPATDRPAAVLEADPGAPLPCAVRAGPAAAAARAALAAGDAPLRALVADAAVVPAAAWRAVDPAGLALRDVDRPGDLDALG